MLTRQPLPSRWKTQVSRCVTVLAWAGFSFAFYLFGLQIYDFLGDGWLGDFATDWAVGVSVENIAQARRLLWQVVEAAFMFAVLDRYNLRAPRRWFEKWLDDASIQATLFTGASTAVGTRLGTFLQFHRRAD